MPVTGHGPASSTVTRSTLPSSWKSWVIPSFLARIAGMGSAELDLDVDEPLVRADLEVLARVLVLEGRADDAVDVLIRGQRNGPGHARAGARRRLDDLLRGRLDRGVVVRLEADADLVLGQSGHGSVL